MRRINLLPWREERREKRQKDFQVHLVLSVILAGVVAAGIHFYMEAQIDHQNQRNAYLEDVINELDQQIQAIDELRDQKAELVARMRVIEDLQSARPIVVHFTRSMVETLPEGVQLTELSVNNDERISIHGYADAQARVADYLRSLNRAEYVDRASLVGSGILAEANGTGRYAFTINARITLPDDEQDE